MSDTSEKEDSLNQDPNQDFDFTKFILGDALDADELEGLNQLGFDPSDDIIKDSHSDRDEGKFSLSQKTNPYIEEKQSVDIEEPFSLDKLLLYTVKRTRVEDDQGRSYRVDKPMRVLKYSELFMPQGDASQIKRAMFKYN